MSALSLLAVSLIAPAVLAQARRVVTVQELFALNHRLEVAAGTEGVWGDPHFERVWFPPKPGPTVRRSDAGFAAVFDTPGTYRGRFTVVGGHATTEVYPLTVIVKDAAR